MVLTQALGQHSPWDAESPDLFGTRYSNFKLVDSAAQSLIRTVGDPCCLVRLAKLIYLFLFSFFTWTRTLGLGQISIPCQTLLVPDKQDLTVNLSVSSVVRASQFSPVLVYSLPPRSFDLYTPICRVSLRTCHKTLPQDCATVRSVRGGILSPSFHRPVETRFQVALQRHTAVRVLN